MKNKRYLGLNHVPIHFVIMHLFYNVRCEKYVDDIHKEHVHKIQNPDGLYQVRVYSFAKKSFKKKTDLEREKKREKMREKERKERLRL